MRDFDSFSTSSTFSLNWVFRGIPLEVGEYLYIPGRENSHSSQTSGTESLTHSVMEVASGQVCSRPLLTPLIACLPAQPNTRAIRIDQKTGPPFMGPLWVSP